MARRFDGGWTQHLLAMARLVRRPEVLVFLPALTLAAYWWGGEEALILTALALPIVFALAGAFRPQGRAAAPLPDVAAQQASRAQVVAMLDVVLRDMPETGRGTACLVVQVDEVDTIEQRHGQAARAEVLMRCADRLCAALREGDRLAPLEGGAFAVALGPVRRLTLEGMVQLSARLQAALSPGIAIGGTQVYATCSVGFCQAGRAPGPDGTALLEGARTAAQEAALQGPGAIRAWQRDMEQRQAVRDTSRAELETALEDGQIRAHFQPQLSTDTGEISGFEALVRWMHPQRGLIPPAEFLPAMEAAGLTDRLAEVMLQGALTALSRWDRAGLNVPRVGVNFSSAELRNPALVERLKWELDRFDLGPERLTVEVLETVVAESGNDVIVSNIAALARLGCGVDLDDFGTGHASIAAIRRFAVRRLKIDRSFVTRVDQDREQQRIVAAVLSLAERLGLDTLAEGVETPAEHAMLAQLGCGHVQGFSIARPMPFEETSAWIASHRARQGETPRLGVATR